MESLKIAMLAPEFLPTWGGVGTYSILLARELSNTDDVRVFTTLRGGGDRERARRGLEGYFDDRVRIHIVSAAKERFWYNAIYQFNIARNLPGIIKREKFDIVHSNHAHMPDLGLKLRGSGGGSVTTVHTTLTSQFTGIKESAGEITHMEGSERMVRFGFPFLTLLERYYLSKTDNLIYVSDFIKGEVSKIKRKPASRQSTVRNGVDIEHFKPLSKEREAKRVNIMYTGRLLALKGLNHLMDAFAKVHKSCPEAHLVLVGDGNIPRWIETASQSGIPKDALTFTGRKDYQDMPGMLASADIFVLPSMSESMPLSLLEAMACGKPCIASSVGGIPEIIKHGETGFLVKAGDVSDLAENMRRLIKDERLRSDLGERGRHHIAKNFNLPDMVKETRRMFLDVASGGTG